MTFKDGHLHIPFSEDSASFETHSREDILELANEMHWERMDAIEDGSLDALVGQDFYTQTEPDTVLKRIAEAAPENAVFALAEDGLLVMVAQLPESQLSEIDT